MLMMRYIRPKFIFSCTAFDLSDGLAIGKTPTFYFFKFTHKRFLLIIFANIRGNFLITK